MARPRTPATGPAPRPRDRIASHVFVFSGTVLAICIVAAFLLPKTTGDTLFSGDLESGEPAAFQVTGDRNVHLYLAHTFAETVGPGQNATLAIRDAANTTVFEANASVGSIGKNKDERDQRLIPSIPVWRPEAPGTYQAVYTYLNGTEARTQLVVVEGGWFLREPWGEVFFASLVPLTGALLVAVFLARPVNREGSGFARFYPVVGATGASLAVASLLGVATAALLLWVSGGGLTGF